MIERPFLHHTELRAPDDQPEHAYLFLHGILGTGANLRGLAQRLVRAEPAAAAVLVDLRGHGRSPDFAPPHRLASCAEDLCRLEAALTLPVTGVIGHSFGGKVALAYHQLRPMLARVALLDSAPSARADRVGSEETEAVLDLLERAPSQFTTREQFLAFVRENGHSRAIADWLAMNLVREPHGFRMRTHVPLIRELLADYFAQDAWPIVEQSRARIDLLVAEHSEVWSQGDLERAEACGPQVRVHRIAGAGHWLHADAPAAVASALSP